MDEDAFVIGYGCADRSDDGVGPLVATRLAALGAAAVAYEGDGTGLLDLWEAQDACIVIDALSGRSPPGEILRFSALDDPAFARARFVRSSHQIGLAEAVALGRMLDRLPKRLAVIGVAGFEFGFGRALTPAVERAADRLVRDLSGQSGEFLG